MRIGILSDILAKDPRSGMGNYARYLVREWSREHEVWSIGSSDRNRGPGFAGHVRVSPWNWRWRRAIGSHTDIVHCPTQAVPDYFYRIQKPRVVTIHGAAPFIFSHTSLVPPPSRGLLRLRAEPAAVDLFLTVSRSAQREIVKHYRIPGERLHPIYHGVDPELFFPPADKAAVRQRVCARRGISGPYLLHISNYRPLKNGVRVVAAYRHLREQGFRELALVLAGGTYFGFEAVAEEIGRPADGQIIRLGKLSDSELRELYQGAEVFLFPSLHEGFGIPALESMACGVPVVVSNTYSLPEVTGEAAVQVNPESVEEIAQGVARLLSDAAFYAECRRAGVARSREFRWDVCGQKHLEAFERAIQIFAARKKKSN